MRILHFLRLYGDWFVGFSGMFSAEALVYTASGVRPSFRPMTRVGVFSLASFASCFTSVDVQVLPVLRVDLLMVVVVEGYSSFRASGRAAITSPCMIKSSVTTIGL